MQHEPDLWWWKVDTLSPGIDHAAIQNHLDDHDTSCLARIVTDPDKAFQPYPGFWRKAMAATDGEDETYQEAHDALYHWTGSYDRLAANTPAAGGPDPIPTTRLG